MEDKAVKTTPLLVAYPLPDKGKPIYGKAWEWTVYSISGVWRCLL